MSQLFPVLPNDPLFVVPRNSNFIPLTDSVDRKHLNKFSNTLGISTPLTFHAFRRAGARLAFQQGAPWEHIMRHGTWKSDAVWSNLSSNTPSTSPVSLAFQAALRLNKEISHLCIKYNLFRFLSLVVVCNTPFLHQ